MVCSPAGCTAGASTSIPGAASMRPTGFCTGGGWTNRRPPSARGPCAPWPDGFDKAHVTSPATLRVWGGTAARAGAVQETGLPNPKYARPRRPLRGRSPVFRWGADMRNGRSWGNGEGSTEGLEQIRAVWTPEAVVDWIVPGSVQASRDGRVVVAHAMRPDFAHNRYVEWLVFRD